MDSQSWPADRCRLGHHRCRSAARLFTIFSAMLEPGDVLATDHFAYPGLMTIADRLRIQLVGVQGDKDGILPDALRAVCRRRKVRMLYCNPTLHNPTNIIVSAERRKGIAEAAEKLGIGIVEDEIFVPCSWMPRR